VGEGSRELGDDPVAQHDGHLADLGLDGVVSEGGSLVLGSWPFDALARRNRAVICGMNLSIMAGVLEGLRARGIVATLDPQPGMCCVVWRPEAT
jgi:predicted ArsR family transcriptional regulator